MEKELEGRDDISPIEKRQRAIKKKAAENKALRDSSEGSVNHKAGLLMLHNKGKRQTMKSHEDSVHSLDLFRQRTKGQRAIPTNEMEYEDYCKEV